MTQPNIQHPMIAACTVFHGLDASALTDLARAARVRRFASHEFVFHQDEPAHALYLLLHGHIRATKLSLTGQQIIVRLIGPCEALGIIAALPQAVYPLSAQALQPCEALYWDHTTLGDLMERHPLLALRALQTVAQRFVELQNQYLELATERVEQRIARALLRLANQVGRRSPHGVLIDLPLSRQNLAEMTGATLYTVSRTLSRWAQQGLVDTGRERVLIRNPHGLVAIAEDLP